MDWFQVLTGQPLPGQPRRGERRPEPEAMPGADVGAVAGRSVRQERQRREGGHRAVPRVNSGEVVIGPGGVIGDERRAQAALSEPREQARRAMHVLWGNQAAQLALRADRRPRIPGAASEAPDFPIGPGGVVGEDGAVVSARAVGVPTTYMRALTGHESGDDPDAEAPTSSAAGLGQFIDSTWVDMMRRYGPRYGLGEGRLANLSNADVLSLKNDPNWSRLMTAEYARENYNILRRETGRDVSEGEVYLAHWLGPEAASALIKAVDQDRRSTGRGRIARDLVTRGAFNANLPIFYTPDANITLEGEGDDRRFVYHGGGRLRTASEVHAAQTRAFRRQLFQVADPLTD